MTPSAGFLLHVRANSKVIPLQLGKPGCVGLIVDNISVRDGSFCEIGVVSATFRFILSW
jgi:hypothetical protein